MAGRFTIYLTKSFVRDLEALPVSAQERILVAIEALETNPTGPPPRVRKLKGKGAGQWRLHIGVYRIRYDVQRRDVSLYRVRHRKDVYR